MKEEVRIININTDGAVESIKDLQSQVDVLKAKLKELESGTAEYESTVNQLAAAEDKLKTVMGSDTFEKPINSVAALKKHINELKDSLVTMDSTSSEYQAAVNEIVASQTKLNQIMSISAGVNSASTGSYNVLVIELNKLRTSLAETSDEAERAKISERIGAISEQLKSLDGTTSVKSLKDEIVYLRDALLNAEKGSDTYKQILDQLIVDQEKLAEVMAAGKTQVSAATGSYNALVNQMSALKKAWRETSDEATRANLGKQIKDINDKLKGFDESIGDFRRNVGNYTQSITDAFGAMGGAAKGMIGPINGVKTAFNALSSHPVVAVLTSLAALLINGLSKGFSSSEENMNKLRVAFSGFKAIGDGVLKLFQGLAGWVGKVAEAAMNFADKLGLVGPKMKARQQLTKQQIELEKKERDSLTKTADLESASAELRAKASEEESYTIQERIKFLQDAQAKDEERLELEKEILTQKALQLEAEMALTQSSSEEYRKLNELKAQITKVDAQISASRRQANKEIVALRRRGLQEQTQANQQRLTLEKELIQQEYDLAEEGSDEQLRLAKELRRKELEIEQEGFRTKIKNRKDYEQAIKLSIAAYNNDIGKLEAQAINNLVTRERELSQRRLNTLREGSVEYYEDLKKTETQIHTLYKAIVDAEGDLGKVREQGFLEGFSEEFTNKLEGRTLEEFKTLESESLKALKNISDNLTRAEDTAAAVFNQTVLNATRPLSSYYEKQLNQLYDTYLDMIQLFNESDEEFELRKQETWNKIIDTQSHYYKAVMDEYDLMYEIASRPVPAESPLLQYFNQLDPLKVLIDKTRQDKDQYERIVDDINQFIISQGKYISTLMPEIWKRVFDSQGFGFTPENIKALFQNNTTALIENTEKFKQVFETEMSNALGKGFSESEAYQSAMDATRNAITSFQDSIKEVLIQNGIIPEELVNEFLARLQAMVDGEKEIVRQSVSTWSERAQAIAGLSGGIADAYEAELKFQVEKKQKSEDVAKDEFEDVKKLRIAEVIVNTLAGATATFMGWQDKGQPWGAIIGAAQFAATLASGWAQIRQIEMTKFGSSGSGSASAASVPMATVTPTMVDYQPQMTGTVTGQQEAEDLANAITSKPIRAYVVESDISDAQQLANQRSEESTF